MDRSIYNLYGKLNELITFIQGMFCVTHSPLSKVATYINFANLIITLLWGHVNNVLNLCSVGQWH